MNNAISKVSEMFYSSNSLYSDTTSKKVRIARNKRQRQNLVFRQTKKPKKLFRDDSSYGEFETELSRYKKINRGLGIEEELKKDDFRKVINKHARCYICNIDIVTDAVIKRQIADVIKYKDELAAINRSVPRDLGASYQNIKCNRFEVDRLVPERGYIKTNINACCRLCNVTKQDGMLTQDVFERSSRLREQLHYLHQSIVPALIFRMFQNKKNEKQTKNLQIDEDTFECLKQMSTHIRSAGSMREIVKFAITEFYKRHSVDEPCFTHATKPRNKHVMSKLAAIEDAVLPPEKVLEYIDFNHEKQSKLNRVS